MTINTRIGINPIKYVNFALKIPHLPYTIMSFHLKCEKNAIYFSMLLLNNLVCDMEGCRAWSGGNPIKKISLSKSLN